MPFKWLGLFLACSFSLFSFLLHNGMKMFRDEDFGRQEQSRACCHKHKHKHIILGIICLCKYMYWLKTSWKENNIWKLNLKKNNIVSMQYNNNLGWLFNSSVPFSVQFCLFHYGNLWQSFSVSFPLHVCEVEFFSPFLAAMSLLKTILCPLA